MENKKENNHIIHIFAAVFISVLLSIIVSVGYITYIKSNLDKQLAQNKQEQVKEVAESESESQSGGPVEVDLSDNEALMTREQRITEIVEKVNPAVVSVVITKDVPIIERYYDGGSGFGTGDPFFDQFFGFDTSPQPQYRENGTRREEIGGGSGFFVSADGYVVTNRHVVSEEGADYTILTNDGRSFDAEILAKDPTIDIAILKVSTGQTDGEEQISSPINFSYLDFADSDNLKLGQTAIAIGNALAEFRNSVSVGVVSGLSRSIVAGSGYGQTETLDNVIQTDTAINPGNSGGPLMNIEGQVIGVNVAVASGSENIGFALPGNIVEKIVQSVKENGEIVRPYLGVRYIPVTEALAERNNLPVDYGSLIQRGETLEDLAIVPGSPADKAGLRENDIILKLDDREITIENPLANVLREKEVGQTITLTVYRSGEEIILEVTLEKAPS